MRTIVQATPGARGFRSVDRIHRLQEVAERGALELAERLLVH
jgi:hypothetical protein